MRNFLSNKELYFIIFLASCSLIMFIYSFFKLGTSVSPEDKKEHLKLLLYSGMTLLALMGIIFLDGFSFVSMK